MKESSSNQELIAEVDSLRTRLAEAEELLRAIRNGEVDAMVVSGPQGEQVFTLQGADHAYRVLIEGMAEGAVTLAPDGTILYCNHRFAGMLSSSLEKVIGASIFSFFATADKETLKMMLMQEVSKRELSLLTEEGTLLPVFISISAVQIGESQVARCMILTDLTEQKRSEEIVASEKLARLIVEQATEAIVVCDETGRIIRTSKATVEICGFDPALQYFENVFDLRFSSGERNDELILPVSAVMQGSDLLNVEASFERKDKRRFYLQLNAGPLRNERMEIIGSVVTLADITERKQLEKMLLQERDRAQKLLDIAGVIILALDTEGIVTLINKKAGKILDCSKEEIIGKDWAETFLPEGIRDDLTASFEMLISGDIEPVEYVENPILTSRGEERIIAWHNTIIRDEMGKIIGTLSSGEDITERKRAEIALQESEQRWATTLASIGDAVIAADLTGRLTFMNAVAEGLTGWTLKEVLMKPVTEVFNIINEHTRLRIEDPVAKVIKHGMIVGLANHTILLRKDGTEVPIDDSGAPIRDKDGKTTGVVLVFRDITERKQAEEELRYHANLVNNVSDAIISTDRELKIRSWNKAAELIYGWQAGEVIGLMGSDVLQTTFPKGLSREDVAKEIFEKGSWEGELIQRTKDGRDITVHARSMTLTDEAGNVIGGVSVSFDITESKRAEEELVRAHADTEMRAKELQAVLDTAPVAIWIAHDPQCWRITGNAYADRILHAPRRGNISRSALPGDAAVSYKVFRKGVEVQPEEMPAQVATATGKAVLGDELELLFPDGRSVHLIESAVPLFDAEGRVRSAVIAAADITELRRGKIALQESEQRWATTLSSIGDAVIAADLTGRLTFMNTVAEALTGWTLKEAAMKPVRGVFNIVNEHTRIRVEDPVAKVIEHGMIVGLANHTILLRRDGTEVPIDDSGAPIKDKDGNITGVVLVFRDITDRKRAEERLRASLAEKEVLLKEIHHRVKNNMQVISSLISLQASSPADPATARILEDLRGRVRTMALVHEKLYMSRDISRVDFTEYARSLLHFIWQANVTDATRVELRLDLEPLLLPMESAVPCGLILNELATNALKHAFRGREAGIVTVSLHTGADGRKCLKVSDNGIGLPESLDWKNSSTLGLQLVSMLTRQLSGTVEVEVRKGEGTEFRIAFGSEKGREEVKEKPT